MAVANRTLQILPGGQSAAPFSYVLPASTSFDLLAVRATFDGTAAAKYLPCVQIISDAGILMAQTVGDSVAAGGSADVTFAPFLDRQGAAGCCDTSATTYDALFTNIRPIALWKFNESAGNTAADSTGNGWNLTVVGVGALGPGDWAWAQPAGPPGTQTPTTAGPGPVAANNTFPALSNNFAAGTWVRVDAQSFLEPAIMRQGDPYGAPGNGGWTMHQASAGGKWYIRWSDGAVGHQIDSNVAGTVGAWTHVGFQVVNGTWELRVNGVKQAATLNAPILATTTVAFANADAGGFYLRGGLSYGFVSDRPLTDGEWASLASPGGAVPSGWVLTSTGTGSSTYSPLQSGPATAGWTLHADGLGGTYWGP